MTLADHFRLHRPITDDDSNDHIDSDTPRSGVATPVPDPSDKRLPGIMHTDNYFNQVGSDSSQSPISGIFVSPGLGSETVTPLPFHRREMPSDDGLFSSDVPAASQEEQLSASDENKRDASKLSSHENSNSSQLSCSRPRLWSLHPYPTPPASNTPSVHNLSLNDSIADGVGLTGMKRTVSSDSCSFTHRKSISESAPSKVRRASMWTPLSSVLTTSNVHANHFSKPSGRYPSTSHNTPNHSRVPSGILAVSSSHDKLHKLTGDAATREKSHPPTPKRALSNQTAVSDTSDHSNGRAAGIDTVAAPSNGASSSAPVKSPRGKLTVKIIEARGIRRSKDPYIVAVFQRNELVSKGPKEEIEDEEEEITKAPMGGIPISRQGSESGRGMAIPMKSRQSSSTSLTDYRDFKMKTRKSLTNPKWDTEAVL